jgi:Type II secretion system (T2SS), protein K
MIKVRIDALTTSNVNQNVLSEQIADGMARLMAWKLATAPAGVLKDGTLARCAWNSDVQVDVVVQDQSGLVDLNTMPPIFFDEFFKTLGASAAQAKEISLAMIEYRDADSEATNGTAEPANYPGRDFGPKNGPFQAIEEIDQLPGMDDAIYRKALPLVTVQSGQAGIDPLTAPKELRILFNESTASGFTGPLAPYQGSSQGKTFGIDVRITNNNGSRFRRKAIAVILRQPEKPFVFLEWQRGGEWHQEPTVVSAPCIN